MAGSGTQTLHRGKKVEEWRARQGHSASAQVRKARQSWEGSGAHWGKEVGLGDADGTWSQSLAR